MILIFFLVVKETPTDIHKYIMTKKSLREIVQKFFRTSVVNDVMSISFYKNCSFHFELILRQDVTESLVCES